MSALSAQERRNLFSGYINDKNVKLNVTHIYLAQLLKEGYIDYILTVNFDDLMLKACALFNFIPPVYDVSVLNDFTTTNFLEKSITYLHGQHHGQWLLNAEGELSKVKAYIPKIFDRICHNRTWIVIGYSGDDELVNEIAKIGSFENELYWIGYNDQSISEKVKTELFERPRMNAYHIKGYDSDSFFLKLHSELKLKTPEIFNKPFSFLLNMMNQVTDIVVEEKSKHKGLFNGIIDRMRISRELVQEAIENIERKGDEKMLIQQIIEKTIKEEFSFEYAEEVIQSIKINNYIEAKKALANFYNDWAVKIVNEDLTKYDEALELLDKATKIDPSNSKYFNNYGIILSSYAISNDEKGLLIECFEKFKIAERLDPNDKSILVNWAFCLFNLGLLEKDTKIFEEAFDKYCECESYGTEKEDTFLFDTWTNSLINYYHLIDNHKQKREIIDEALLKAKKAYKYGGSPYNLACVYALRGEVQKAYKFLIESLERKLIKASQVENDKDWNNLKNNDEFIDIINQYK